VTGAGALVDGLPLVLTWSAIATCSALLGSFLNVCISRLPRGESVVLPASHCPRCRVPIRPRDNIPLVSFALLRGRCRACRTPISWRYPIVEGLAMGAGLLALGRLGPTWDAGRTFLLVLALVAVTFTDLETRRIPDRLTLSGLILALAVGPEGLGRGGLGALAGAVLFGTVSWSRDRALSGPVVPDPDDEGPTGPDPPGERRWLDALWAGAWGALLGRQVAAIDLGEGGTGSGLAWGLRQLDPLVVGALLGGGLFFLVAWTSHRLLGRTGMGGGDIKLAAMIGAFLGPGGILVATFVGIMLGGVTAVVLLTLRLRRLGEYVAFGPYLAAGGFVSALWGPALLEWYLG
jgi:leader peptidase (prepilin peptidase)/N-methyltransferase